LLASAIVGKTIGLVFLTDPAALSYSDGDRIFLAPRGHAAELRRELMVQSALIAGESLGGRQMRAILGRTEHRDRYLLLEVLRSCQAISDWLPSSFLRELAPFQSKHRPQSPDESLTIAASRSRLPDLPQWFGTLRPWRILRASISVENQKLTQQKLKELQSKISKINRDGDQDDEEEENYRKTSFWKWVQSPLGRDTFMSHFFKEILNMKSSPDKDSANSGASASTEMVSGRVSKRVHDISNAIRSGVSFVLSPGLERYDNDLNRYPEWDCGARRYRSNWTCVEEVDAVNGESRIPPGMLSSMGDRDFQRAMAKLGLSYERHRGLPMGDDLAPDKLIDLAINVRSGHSGDERIYTGNLKTRRDLGIQILLDVSSSTLERSADLHRVFDLQAQTAWSVCRAFARLGDRVAMHGFHSWGRGLVRLQTLKSFDERTTQSLEQRFRRLQVAGYTRCGAAIRHGIHRLEHQAGTPFKLLLIISDGFPYDDEYEGDYASADTRKAIEEARARGVAVLCLSVGSDADANRLEQVYGATNYLAITRTEQLPARLGRLIEAAIVGVVAPAASGR
jgi:nitric oxide reductase activation protein